MLYKTILCATDGLEHSDRALRRAGDMARESRAELHIVHVADPPAGARMLNDGFNAMLQAERRQRIRLQINELSDGEHGVTVVPHFLPDGRGSIAQQVAKLADRIDADLIVAGSRGRGMLGGALGGSVAQRLPHETQRPVLVLAGRVPARTPLGRIRDAAHV
jgi:nucleotide-binding universal stress UspA family protein